MSRAPQSGNPMENRSIRNYLQNFADGGALELRAVFGEGIKESCEGTYDALELDGNVAACTAFAVALGLDPVGRDIVKAEIPAQALAALRSEVPLNEAIAAIRTLRGELSRGLLEDLGTAPDIASAYRDNIEHLGTLLETAEVAA